MIMRALHSFFATVGAIYLLCITGCNDAANVIITPDNDPQPPSKVTQSLVFCSDRETSPARQIYIMRIDGTSQTRISHDLNDYVNPVFSPDGATILASTNTPDGSNEIYAMNADGSNLRNLSNAAGDDDCATYNMDGSRIVFTSTRDGNSEIYVMDSGGGSQTRLTFNDVIDHAPHFSPDGSKIFYCSTKIVPGGSFSYDTDIYVMNADGSNKRCLTEESTYHFYAPFLGREAWFRQDNHYPSISSDGSRILFSSYDSGHENNLVIVMDAVGGNRRVVYPGDFAVNPLFAPGDSMIVFMTHRDGKYDLYEMAFDGTRQRKLTVGIPGHVRFSQFSPDGSTIVLSTDVGSYLSGSYQAIWTMSRNGSVRTQLTFGGGNDFFPHFQPIRQ